MAKVRYNPPFGFTITKIEAARRQLDTALELWFRDEDILSIHTLTGAAGRILLDLCQHQKLHQGLFDTSFIKKGKESEYKNLLRYPETFLKHAKDDPADTIKFNPEVTNAYLLNAIQSYVRLTGKLTLHMIAFRYCFFLTEPSVFKNDPLPVFQETDRVYLRGLGRKQFMSEFITIFKRRGH